MVKYSKDKEKLVSYLEEHEQELKKLDYTESLAALMLLGESKTAERYLFETKENKEDEQMCKALDELRIDWKNEGREEGREEGISVLINLCKDTLKYTEEQIAEQISQRFHISEEQSWRYVRKYHS